MNNSLMIHTHIVTLYSCKHEQDPNYLIWNDFWERLLSEKVKMPSFKGLPHTLPISCKGKTQLYIVVKLDNLLTR